jgi:hypothetical protein
MNKSTRDLFDRLGVSKRTKLNDDIQKKIDNNYAQHFDNFEAGDVQYTSKIRDLCTLFFHSADLQTMLRISSDVYRLYREDMGPFKPSAVAAGIVMTAFRISKVKPLCESHQSGYCHGCMEVVLHAMFSDKRFNPVSIGTFKNVTRDICRVKGIQNMLLTKQ